MNKIFLLFIIVVLCSCNNQNSINNNNLLKDTNNIKLPNVIVDTIDELNHIRVIIDTTDYVVVNYCDYQDSLPFPYTDFNSKIYYNSTKKNKQPYYDKEIHDSNLILLNRGDSGKYIKINDTNILITAPYDVGLGLIGISLNKRKKSFDFFLVNNKPDFICTRSVFLYNIHDKTVIGTSITKYNERIKKSYVTFFVYRIRNRNFEFFLKKDYYYKKNQDINDNRVDILLDIQNKILKHAPDGIQKKTVNIP